MLIQSGEGFILGTSTVAPMRTPESGTLISSAARCVEEAVLLVTFVDLPVSRQLKAIWFNLFICLEDDSSIIHIACLHHVIFNILRTMRPKRYMSDKYEIFFPFISGASYPLNHHRNPPMARDLDPVGRHVARRLRACSAAYMALGASLLVAAGDHDRERAVVGFLLWMAGTALLLLSSVATRLPAVAAGVAQDVLEELCASAPATVIALAHKLMRRHPL